jgi:3-deoxy-manno-octulosonate cytidylyltransferase (CMP-KDO synthetase)
MELNMAQTKKVIGVIPARLASTRLSEKMLREINGEPLVTLTAKNVLSSGVFDEVVIATDSKKILEVCEKAGFKAFLTDESLPSGTCRVGEVAKLTNADIYVNIQGDEPLVSKKALKDLVESFKAPEIAMATLAYPLAKEDEANPNVVKVITDVNQDAIYFSRSLIPFPRESGLITPLKHLGVYGFRRQTLLDFLALPPCALEKVESLEQLRALYHGIKIRVLESDKDSIGIDTIEDLERVQGILKA